MTIYVLFADDIKLLATDRYVDNDFSISYFVCMLTFIFELVANSWVNTTWIAFDLRKRDFRWTGYLLSFFWLLDLISIISLWPDINIIAQAFGMEFLNSSKSTGSRSFLAFRLVRLVRLARLYRIASERRARRLQEEEMMALVSMGAIRFQDIDKHRALYGQRQSKLGTQLSESTTKKVILIILILLIVIPLLIYVPENKGPKFATQFLNTFSTSSVVSNGSKQAVLDSFIHNLQDAYNNRYISVLTVSPTFGSAPYVSYSAHLDGLRDSSTLEVQYVQTVSSVVYDTFASFNIDYLVRSQALFSILTTIFVAIMMIGGAVVINNDAERMVIAPIERMMNMVEAVAEDPLSPFYFEHDTKPGAGDYETRLLETTVEKITGLLRVGFGEAGAGIISANLRNRDSGAAINPLLPGVRMYAIFGFCDIHHFEDINQSLGGDVLTFVNTIAEIVHNSVHTWSGQCNKNLGNAFVIVWRIGDEQSLQSAPGAGRNRAGSFEGPTRKSVAAGLENALAGVDENGETKRKAYSVDLRRIPGVDTLADHALIAYLKIIAEINRSKRVLKYRKEPRLTKSLREEFKVRMGFGLHAGWAIEGAVGSIQKVDATYLSPHVNMSARLETSSRQYGVPLLASQDFFDLLSNEAQQLCRRLDVVTVKGSEVPIGIYTYDAFQDQDFKEDTAKKLNKGRRLSDKDLNSSKDMVAPPPPPSPMPSSAKAGGRKGITAEDPNSTKESPVSSKKATLSFKPGAVEKPVSFLTPEDRTGDVFENDYDVLTLRAHVNTDFLETFKEGVQMYLAGDWMEAKSMLEKADGMMAKLVPSQGGDGPSRTLLNYMGNCEFKAPPSWKGFRPLTAK